MSRSDDKPQATAPGDLGAEPTGALPEGSDDEAIVEHDPTLRWILSDYDAPMNITPPPVTPSADGRTTPPLQPVPQEWTAPALSVPTIPVPPALSAPPATMPAGQLSDDVTLSRPEISSMAIDPVAHVRTPPPLIRTVPASPSTPTSEPVGQRPSSAPLAGSTPAEFFAAEPTPPSPTEIIAGIIAGAAPDAEVPAPPSDSDLSADAVEETTTGDDGARAPIVAEQSAGSTLPNDVLEDETPDEAAIPAAPTVVAPVGTETATEPREVEPEAVEMLESAEYQMAQEPTPAEPPPTPPPVHVEPAASTLPSPPATTIAAALFDELEMPTNDDSIPEALARRSLKKRTKPWYEEVFDEDFLRTLPFTTPEQTSREVAFIRQSLAPPKGAELLDIGCGYGRHALELAQLGFRLTGLDLSLPMLIRAADHAQRRGLTVNFVHADMREMTFNGQFDGAYCMLSSFGYFDEETNLRVATAICKALKPGGKLLLDIINRDYIVGDLPSRAWWEGDGCVVLEEVDFNYHTSRVLIRRSVVFGNGRQSEQEISMRAYSLHEVGKLLRQAGLRVLDVSGSLATKSRFFGAASRNIVALCERPAP
jgi:2-polyprenyl-3-methyl-5-hydroxy-6-metoxy-1,4-benzoquinol methylase